MSKAGASQAPEDRRRPDFNFQRLVEHSTVGWSISQDGRLLYVNPKYCELFGYSREELLRGASPLDIVAEADRPAVEASVAGLLQGTSTDVELEIKGRRKDGSLVDLELRAGVMELNGRLALIADFTDVSARKRAEESSAQLAAIVESTHAAIFRCGLDGLITSWNPGAAKLFGYDAAEAIGRSAELLAPDELKAEQRRHIEAVKRGESFLDYETVRLGKGGKAIDVLVTASPIRDRARGIIGASVILLDIGERKRTERELARSMRALKTLSAANAALVREGSRQALLEEMCRVVVEVGGYRLAWVGLAETGPEKAVRPVARAGVGAEALDRIKVSWAEDEFGRGPTGIAIRSGTIQVSQNFALDPRISPWRALAAELGCASAIVLPLSEGAGVLGVLAIYASEPDAFGAAEVELLSELASDVSFGLAALKTRAERETALLELEQNMEKTLEIVASTIEMRDPYTAGHQRRVATIAEAIAAEMGLAAKRIHGLRLASIVHDLGKINVPAEILSKSGKLLPSEYALIKSHPQVGYDILKPVEFPWPIAEIVLEHHERLDGSGYPNGLQGDAILLEAKIVSVADVVESMLSHRPYRPALGLDAALGEIESGSGRLYQPEVVAACVALFRSGRLKLE